jgi:hypothetical protein
VNSFLRIKMSFQQQHDRRSGKRIRLSFHVEIAGLGSDGAPFCEHAAASDVSDRGCQIVLSRALRVGDQLNLRVVRATESGSRETFLYQVMWVGASAGAWVAGLAALDQGNPWRMNFPSAAVATK